MDKPQTPEFSEQQLSMIAQIRRIAAFLGKETLSQREFDKYHAEGGVSTVGYHFGSWNRAISASGLITMPSGGFDREIRYTDEELIQDILRLQNELSKIPSEREVSRFGKFSLKPYRDRWGSLRKAVALASAS